MMVPFWWGMGSSKGYKMIAAVRNVGGKSIDGVQNEEDRANREDDKVDDAARDVDITKSSEQK